MIPLTFVIFDLKTKGGYIILFSYVTPTLCHACQTELSNRDLIIAFQLNYSIQISLLVT